MLYYNSWSCATLIYLLFSVPANLVMKSDSRGIDFNENEGTFFISVSLPFCPTSQSTPSCVHAHVVILVFARRFARLPPVEPSWVCKQRPGPFGAYIHTALFAGILVLFDLLPL